MTTRIKALTVTLSEDMREDDTEAVLTALRMVKGVIDVTAHVADLSDHVARLRAQRDIETRILAALRGA